MGTSLPGAMLKHALEQRQVLREIEANPEIGEFTGKEVVTSAHGSQRIALSRVSVKMFRRVCHED
jgi:hypothetical protein